MKRFTCVADDRGQPVPHACCGGGFAAETSNLVEHAQRKLREKGLHLVVANNAEQAIGSRDNQVTLVWPNGDVDQLPLMPKSDVAELVIERVGTLLAG